MSVQYAEGNITMNGDDFQATEAGITYGVKFRFFPAIGETMGLIMEQIDGAWVVAQSFATGVDSAIVAAGGPQAYADNIVKPAVKAWLAQRKLQKPTPAQEVAAIVGKWQAPL